MVMSCHSVKIVFHKTEYWGIPLTIRCGGQSVDLRTYNTSNPYPSLLKWLEEITTGAEHCAFDINEEGDEKRLALDQLPGKSIFSISNTYNESEIYTRQIVDPVQLVRAFYNGLVAYSRSKLYISSLWRGENLADRIRKNLHNGKTLNETRNELANLSRANLLTELFNICPSYKVTFPGVADENERNELELRYLFDSEGAKHEAGSEIDESPWEVRDDFDDLTAGDRSQYIDKLLNTTLNNPLGSKLEELNSSILKEWLSSLCKDNPTTEDY